ncbi:MAG: hypothetical protein KM310_11510 [Clostridiales bacterium]|nr:hypothetical protein [Clostridiales bacterium]
MFRVFQRQRQWYMGLDLEEDPVLEVLQDGEPLQKDPRHNLWIIPTPGRPLTLRMEDSDGVPASGIDLPSFPIIFRLDSSGQKGQVIRYPRRGIYGFIVPQDWKLDPSHRPLTEPQPFAWHGHLVWLLSVDDLTGTIRFLRPDRKEAFVSTAHSLVELQGPTLPDGQQAMGSLFYGDPPRFVPGRGGEHLAAAILGEEGEGRGRWKTPLEDLRDEEAIAKALMKAPPILRQGGWFFLRLYDQKHDLLESLSFRYVQGLRLLEHHHDPWGGEGEKGQSLLHLKVLLNPGWHLDVADGALRPFSSLRRQGDMVELEVQGFPGHDRLELRIIPPQGKAIPWYLPVGRLAWCKVEGKRKTDGDHDGGGDDRDIPWTFSPIRLWEEDFRPTSTAELHIKLPLENLNPKDLRLLLGRQPVALHRPQEGVIHVPLKDLYDLIPRSQDLDLDLTLRAGDKARVVGFIRRRWACPHCGHGTKDPKDLIGHVLENHWREYLKPLTYEEMARRHSDLPRKIYRCSYCGDYVPAGRQDRSATTAIEKHQTDDCPKAREAAGGSSVKIRIIPVEDADEIRRTVMERLPREYRCILCRDILSLPHDADPLPSLKAHLTTHEEDLLLRLRKEDDPHG